MSKAQDTHGFLPANYEAPRAGGQYLKLEKGKTQLRIVSSAVVGYVGWDRSGAKPQPVRSKDKKDLVDFDTKEDRVKHFWICAVLDRGDDAIVLWEITQSTIQKSLNSLVTDPEWGEPSGYDISITRTGDGLETSYTVMPSPKKPLKLSPEQQEQLAGMKLDNIFVDGADIFS